MWLEWPEVLATRSHEREEKTHLLARRTRPASAAATAAGLVKPRDSPHARVVLELDVPACKDLHLLLLDARVGVRVAGDDLDALDEALVGKGGCRYIARVSGLPAMPMRGAASARHTFEAGSAVLDEDLEDGQGAELAVDVAVLELLANGTGSLGRAATGRGPRVRRSSSASVPEGLAGRPPQGR